MKDFHLNLGSRFAQPYESAYALLRRCLIANPGIPFSIIKKNLQLARPDLRNVFERLRAKQLVPSLVNMDDNFKEWRDYGRQCPRCARHLYHTDIYALPWLTRCPLHHCAFTSTCPVCSQPWPDIDELAKRNCSGCGICDLAQLGRSILANINKQNYHPIGELYEFIYPLKNEDYLIFFEKHKLDYTGRQWWQEPTITSANYPTFQMIQHSSSISAEKLKRLNIQARQLRCKATRVLPTDAGYVGYVGMWGGNLSRSARVRLSNVLKRVWPPQLDLDFSGMRYIMAWISHQTTPKHKIHISSYRYLKIEDLINGPNPCPFCLAFNLWFFHTAAEHYNDRTINTIDDYPFCIQAGLGGFLSGFEPFIFADATYFTVNKDFSSWFYSRGLEISFLDILQFAFSLLTSLNEIRQRNHHKSLTTHKRRKPSDCLYWAKIDEGMLYFYYENEHPLDRYAPENIFEIDQACHSFHAHHEKHKLDKNKFTIKEIPETGLTYDEFYSLHMNIHEIVKNPYPQARNF